jgi:hypothetical protein
MIHPPWKGTMLDNPIVWSLALRLPALFSGRTLHRTALHASRAGAWNTAEGLFERAAAHYRMELAVESLARLRIHQLVTRARAAGNSAREADLLLESAQRLARLDLIESFDPPFELIPARDLFETGSLGGNPHPAAGVPLRNAA